MPTSDLTLLHLDDDLVAVDKPSGLLVHPSQLDAHAGLTALDLLQSRLGQRLWPLHRLDKGTSGVLLMARHVEAARFWGEAFQASRVGKRYRALVRGWPPAEGRIDQPLARDPERPSAGQPTREAVTDFRSLARFDWPFQVDARHPTSRYALVEAWPLTGRRHQIRRHFKHIAHPLVGDSTHGKGAHNRAVAAWLGQARLWLHACEVILPRAGDAGDLRIVSPCGPGWPGAADAPSDPPPILRGLR
jgi:tRNA pseudouridine65 synthase